MKSNLVERVAKAIMFADCGNTEHWEGATDLAEAAIRVCDARNPPRCSYCQASTSIAAPVQAAPTEPSAAVERQQRFAKSQAAIDAGWAEQAATPAPVAADTLTDLRRALQFIDQVREQSEEAAGTGAMRDAREWLEMAARDLVASPARAIPADDPDTPLESDYQ